MEASGVRNSWETLITKSLRIRSSFSSSECSCRNCATVCSRFPAVSLSVRESCPNSLKSVWDRRDRKLPRASSPACAMMVANYASALPPGDLQDDTVVGIAHEWSFRDSTGAAKWLIQFPAGKLRDRAVEPLFFWGGGQCPAALAEMLDTFGEPELFNKHAEQVAGVWLNRSEEH